MIKYLHILLFASIAACCNDHFEECPCYADHQNPIYKGCAPGTVYDLDNNCSVSSLFMQLYTSIKYPHEAIEDSIQGTVTIAFDVFEDGSIGNYTVFKDTLGHGLANAAIDAIKTLDNKGFCPARENCEPVIFNFKLPVKFVLH